VFFFFFLRSIKYGLQGPFVLPGANLGLSQIEADLARAGLNSNHVGF